MQWLNGVPTIQWLDGVPTIQWLNGVPTDIHIGWMVFYQCNGWMVFQRIFTLVEWCSINAMVEWCSNGYIQWLRSSVAHNCRSQKKVHPLRKKVHCLRKNMQFPIVLRSEAGVCWLLTDLLLSCSLVHSVVKLAPHARWQSDVSAPACARPCTRRLL